MADLRFHDPVHDPGRDGPTVENRPKVSAPLAVLLATAVLVPAAAVAHLATATLVLAVSCVVQGVLLHRHAGRAHAQDRRAGEGRAVLRRHEALLPELRRQAADEQARRDDLTGLGNRRAFIEQVEAIIATGHAVAVVLIDLDGFREVNDSLGHDGGDRCLVGVSARLSELPSSRGRLFRLGGDEFVILLEDGDEDEAVALAEAVLTAVRAPWQVDDHPLDLSASIGIAQSSPHSTTAAGLLSAADLALFRAKSRARGAYWLSGPALVQESLARQALNVDLRRALRDSELALVYQPIIDLEDGALLGVEALVRWTHPEHGPVSPAEFIPAAEDSGLIVALGEHVLREACRQLLAWDAAGGDRTLQMSVNVSTRQLERRGLLGTLDDCLSSGVDPARLVLEVTETALTLDGTTAAETLQAIRNRGVRIAVDDFGQGQSSLSRLRSAPVSKLKIDRAFVSDIVHEGDSAPVVDATLAMAFGLGLGVVAEGIETVVQLEHLRTAGCPQAQGFLLSRPLSPDRVLELLTGPKPWLALFARPPAPRPSTPVEQLVDLAVTPRGDLASLVRPLLAALQVQTQLETTYLYQVDPTTQEGLVRYAHGPDRIVHEGQQVDFEDSLCQHALREGPRRTSHAPTAFGDTDLPSEIGLTSYLMAPVTGPDGQLFGTLCGVSGDSVPLSPRDSETIDLYARLISNKLKLLASTEAPQRLASEPSTGLSSRRRHAHEQWQRERERRVHALGGDDTPASSRERALLAETQAAFEAHLGDTTDGELDHGQRRVVVVDDDKLLRELVGAFVTADPRLCLVGQVESAGEVLGLTIAAQPDILVLDYELDRGWTCEDVIEDLRTFAPGTRILLHSARRDIHQIGQRLNVDRAVGKGQNVERLIDALSGLAG